MFCKNCGKEIDDNALVCPNCGVATEKMQQEAAITATAEAPATKKVNVCAILGLIFSILAFVGIWVFGWLFYIGAPAALVLSIVGIVMSKKLNNGKGLAIAGLVVTIFDVVFYLIFLFVLVALIYGAVA